MSRRKTQPYVPPHRYTPEELLDCDILDLESDYRCAVRDNEPEYAATVLSELEIKRATRSRLYPKPNSQEGS